MRSETDKEKLHRLMKAIGQGARGPGNIYFTGGTTAVLRGWRSTTIDVDMKLDPEPKGIFECLARIKDELNINIELAAPDDFIPPLPSWRDRSPFIEQHGPVRFFEYDFYAQALAKIERGHQQDLEDVRQMLLLNLVERQKLKEMFDQIEPALNRFPAIEPEEFRRKLEEALGWRRIA